MQTDGQLLGLLNWPLTGHTCVRSHIASPCRLQRHARLLNGILLQVVLQKQPPGWYAALQNLLACAMQISVDGDTSTNDTCLGFANGAAGGDLIGHVTEDGAQQLQAAVTALLQVTQSLHLQT